LEWSTLAGAHFVLGGGTNDSDKKGAQPQRTGHKQGKVNPITKKELLCWAPRSEICYYVKYNCELHLSMVSKWADGHGRTVQAIADAAKAVV
jgi:hypothetical protein